MSIFIIGEIGINHNGDLDIAKKLIDGAVNAGADAVKFQKREIELVYSKEYLDSPRESPWGLTQRDQKEGLEFNQQEYSEIERYCKAKRIEWFASPWDVESLNFLNQYDLKYNKLASAMLSNIPLIKEMAKQKRYTFISTGMHTMAEIEQAVNIFLEAGCEFELMHCNSTYPMQDEDANLNVIKTLRDHFGCKVGYSGHEVGLTVSVAASALGVTSVERHITLDRAMYGSDQAASVEIGGFIRLVRMIRTVEKAMGDGKKRVSEKEKPIREKLMPSNIA